MKKLICISVSLILLTLSCFPMQALTANDKTVVAFGDSITASGAWFSVANKAFGISTINMGVGGENSQNGLSRLNQVLAKKPDVATVSFGMNDSAKDMAKYVELSKYKENMAKIIETLLENGTKVILVIASPIVDSQYYTRHKKEVFEEYGGPNAFYTQYVQAGRELAKEYNLVLMDMYQVFMDTGNYASYSADGVHPNTNGYKLYAEEFRKALIRIDLGDINGDEKVDTKDYIMLKRHVLHTYTITDRVDYADLDGNGKLETKDYILLKRCVLNTYSVRSVEKYGV